MYLSQKDESTEGVGGATGSELAKTCESWVVNYQFWDKVYDNMEMFYKIVADATALAKTCIDDGRKRK